MEKDSTHPRAEFHSSYPTAEIDSRPSADPEIRDRFAAEAAYRSENLRERTIADIHGDLDKIYGTRESIAEIAGDPAIDTVPDTLQTFDEIVAGPQARITETEKSERPGLLRRATDKFFRREIHGIKLSPARSLLAATLGYADAQNRVRGPLDWRNASSEMMAFNNPYLRPVLYKAAQNDPGLAHEILQNDRDYAARRRLTDGEKSLSRVLRAATLLPSVGYDMLTAPLTLTGLAREDSGNRFLRGVARSRKALESFVEKPLARRKSIYNLDRFIPTLPDDDILSRPA